MILWRYLLPAGLMLLCGHVLAIVFPIWFDDLLPVNSTLHSSVFGAICGSVLGFVIYQWIDTLLLSRYMRWLRTGSQEQAPKLLGVWAEVMERTRRTLRVEQRATAEESRKLQEFLMALQASPNGVILLDEHNQIEWFNQTAANLFGLRQGSDERQAIEHLVRDPGFIDYLHKSEFGQEWTMQAGKKAGLPVQISVQIHSYGKGRKLMLGRDVTQIARAEAMRRDFVANVSHELRTPLTVLNGFVETLQHVPLPLDDQRRYLDLMSQQGQRMKSLVEDLLTLSRLEASALPGMSEWFDLGKMLEQCAQEARTLSYGRHSIEFVPAPADVAMDIAGSSLELHSAFSNLVSNAIRYTPSQGCVQVSWQIDAQGRGVFKVTDTGAGIAPEHLPRLTERFYRVDRSRSRETGGTGLGLAIVKHVVQRHGGELLIESLVGKGSTFTIRVPASRLKMHPL
jgi:two-component system phosphate regulon sensor histidine kinase PhoR